ncbi:MAG: DNA-deoxyinosine glycosylase [Aminipila sp.]
MAEYETVKQPFEPIYNENSKILILGSLPSVKSRETGFFYGHPQNRFWKLIAKLYRYEVPETIEEKKKMLMNEGIALWDVIETCEIKGSDDNSIRNIVIADFNSILEKCNIEKIIANGKTTAKLYNRYAKCNTGREIIELPSTSPANARYSLEALIEKWGEHLGNNEGNDF